MQEVTFKGAKASGLSAPANNEPTQSSESQEAQSNAKEAVSPLTMAIQCQVPTIVCKIAVSDERPGHWTRAWALSRRSVKSTALNVLWSDHKSVIRLSAPLFEEIESSIPDSTKLRHFPLCSSICLMTCNYQCRKFCLIVDLRLVPSTLFTCPGLFQ
ncbi:uncharacterized protein EI90DRAFT_3071124 [Cantharellus anzutake]|uniref:uncharacterized protein n=1 Tax=Cantharellus anzutake TaxID=1750568 RepID=UPI00190502F5|nr:uncharacterized protein EI90DRAFT_3071124 [Cantharellus anzutake]KAF8326008.1 hypothetical protein EI90DRAFT_3071124 [Cantharellus anzutake]